VNRRIVIADAGPLIALARIESLNLLRDLFGQVCITTQVRDEILPAGSTFPDTALLKRTLAEGWINVVEAPASDWKPLNPGIDPGEASAIRAARHRRDAGDAVLLVMDDRAGRLEAKAQGIALIGTAG
jgi:predicted nucleic acid-binding protein